MIIQPGMDGSPRAVWHPPLLGTLARWFSVSLQSDSNAQVVYRMAYAAHQEASTRVGSIHAQILGARRTNLEDKPSLH